MGQPEPREIARSIIDEIAYMTIATADAGGKPWASPVWFAHDAYSEFVWVSRLDTKHSQNIAERSEVSLVIFDSRTPIDTGRGVYIEVRDHEPRVPGHQRQANRDPARRLSTQWVYWP